jgi:two-component system nitrogen regulation response regulator GlnG
VPTSVLARLVAYDWPGNVRELRNVVRQLVISNRWNDTFRDDTLAELLQTRNDHSAARPQKRVPADIESAELAEMLQRHQYRYGATATALGISRNSLLALIERSPALRRPKDFGADELHQAITHYDGEMGRAALALKISLRGLQLRLKELEKSATEAE